MVDLQNLFLQIYLMTAGPGTLPYIVNNGPRRNHHLSRSSYSHRHLRMRRTAIHLRISYLPSSSCTIFSLNTQYFHFLILTKLEPHILPMYLNMKLECSTWSGKLGMPYETIILFRSSARLLKTSFGTSL